MQIWALKLPSQRGAGTTGILFSWLMLGFRASQLLHKTIALTTVAIYLQSWQPAQARNKATLPFLLQTNILRANTIRMCFLSASCTGTMP